MNFRMYFGDYCKHTDKKGPCLAETDKKCDICERPMCSRHRKLSKNTGEMKVCLDCVFKELFKNYDEKTTQTT